MGRLGLALLSALLIGSCGPARGDLRPGRGWREVELDDHLAYRSDQGAVTISVSGLHVNSDGIVKVHIWVFPREIETVSVEAADIVLIDADGRACPNDAGARKEFATRSRHEPFMGVFEVEDIPRLRRDGCTLRISVVPYAPSEGTPILVEVRYFPF